jgi:ABC-type transport system involved in multi-copper enzyme maturation permease subunit
MRILTIARNVFRGLLSKRALYVWAAAVLLMLLRSGPAIFLSDRNPQFQAYLRANAISAALDTWALLALAAAIFLGAASVGAEKNGKTIVTVLARPLHRWEFIVGHWLGVVLFSLVSLAIGLLLASGLAWYMGIAIDGARAAIALAETTAGVMLFAAVGVALGANASVALAAGVTVLLAFLPPLVEVLRNDSKPWQHYPGVVLHYLIPPGYTSHYAGMTWADPPQVPTRGPLRQLLQTQRPDIDYGAATKRLSTNLAYGAVYFLIGIAVFTRKDAKFA